MSLLAVCATLAASLLPGNSPRHSLVAVGAKEVEHDGDLHVTVHEVQVIVSKQHDLKWQ